MPIAEDIVLADAQATPVNHTFIPVGRDAQGVFWYEDQSAATVAGYWKISVELKTPQILQPGQSSAATRVYRARVGLHEPVMENVTNAGIDGILPAPTVSYILRGLSEYLIPERSSLLDRKNVRKMSALLQDDDMVIALIEQFQLPR